MQKSSPPRELVPSAADRASPERADEGATVAPASRPPCPPEMALIDGRFCIDRWEAVLLDGSATQHSPYQCCKALERSAETSSSPAAPALGEEPRGAGADPPSFRSFYDASGRLPHAPPPPPYESAGAACPVDMALVEGKRCGNPVQTCKRWLDPPGKPHRSCAEFEAPTRCAGAEHKMRFCVDRYEFTPPEYSRPIVQVSWTEAQVLCQAMQKRLCAEEEWEFACEGPAALPYPYGHVRDGSACNHDTQDSLFTPFGKLVDRRTEKHALPRCVSPFGVFNLVGNVDEWTTRVRSEPGERSVLRGGWWLQGRNRCRAATDSHGEKYAGPQTGFRCCRKAR